MCKQLNHDEKWSLSLAVRLTFRLSRRTHGAGLFGGTAKPKVNILPRDVPIYFVPSEPAVLICFNQHFVVNNLMNKMISLQIQNLGVITGLRKNNKHGTKKQAKARR